MTEQSRFGSHPLFTDLNFDLKFPLYSLQTPLQIAIERAVTKGRGFKNCIDGRPTKYLRDAEFYRRLKKWDTDLDLQYRLGDMEFNDGLSKHGFPSLQHFFLFDLMQYCKEKGIDLHEYNSPERVWQLYEELKHDFPPAKLWPEPNHVVGYYRPPISVWKPKPKEGTR